MARRRGTPSQPEPRVRVAARQLQQWYRTPDQLLACKAQVESALFVRLRDLFSLQVDMVLYDLTCTAAGGGTLVFAPRAGWMVPSRSFRSRVSSSSLVSS
jgi:hypothetical protein